MTIERLIFSLGKKYSLPILILLYFRDGLTFDQIYDLSLDYKTESSASADTLMERKGSYGAISRESISRALNELIKAKRIKKEAKLGKRKAYVTYILTDNTKKLMDKYFKHTR